MQESIDAPRSAPTKASPWFPDFFIVGAPKCGTTSLYNWLSLHPQVHSPHKEPGYFSQDILPLQKTWKDYLNIFSEAPEGSVIGEATPKYLYSPFGLREIAKFNPKVRIIVLLRPPASLVASWHSQMIKEGVETERSLEKAWALTKDRRAGRSIPRSCPSAALLDYPRWGAIGSCMKDLYSVFDANQIMVLLLEDIRDQPDLAYQKVLTHLNVSNDYRQYFPIKNPRYAVRSIRLHHMALWLHRTARPVLEPVYRLRAGRGTGLLKALSWLNQESSSKVEKTSPEFLYALNVFYNPEVHLLQDIIKRDLSHWRVS